MPLSRGLSMNRDQMLIEIARDQAIIKAGKNFIDLKLVDTTKNRIQGAMILDAKPYEDPATRQKAFRFEEKGGPLVFTLDEFKGGMYTRMLDCEHNRDFLASMMGSNFWVIEDPAVLMDVQKRADKIKADAIKKANEPQPEPEEANQCQRQQEKIARPP